MFTDLKKMCQQVKVREEWVKIPQIVRKRNKTGIRAWEFCLNYIPNIEFAWETYEMQKE